MPQQAADAVVEQDLETSWFDGGTDASQRLDWQAQAWIHRRLAAFALLAVLSMGAVVGIEMRKTPSLFRYPQTSWHVGLDMGHLRMDEEHERNPYVGHPLYQSPNNRAAYDTAISRRVALPTGDVEDPRQVPTAVWIDSKAKVTGRGLSSLEGVMEDASWRITRELVTLVMHNLPNKGCDDEAPRAEVCCSRLATGQCDYMASDCAGGLREYRQEFVDPFVRTLQNFKATFPVAVVVEPGSAAGLVARPGMTACRGATTRFAYSEGLRYAVQQLVEKTPWVTIYLDGGHGGWLGSHELLVSYFQALKALQLPVRRVRGFATNVGSQRPLGKAVCPWKPVNASNAYCLVGRNFDPCCEDPCQAFRSGNAANSEMNFAQELAHNAKEVLRMDAHMITDTSRNGQLQEGAGTQSACRTGGCGNEVVPGVASTAEVHASAVGFLDAYFWVAHPAKFQACDFPLPAQEAHGSSFTA